MYGGPHDPWPHKWGLCDVRDHLVYSGVGPTMAGGVGHMRLPVPSEVCWSPKYNGWDGSASHCPLAFCSKKGDVVVWAQKVTKRGGAGAVSSPKGAGPGQ